MKSWIAGTILACVTACAPTSEVMPPPPAAGSNQTISYSTGPCFGFCPVYTVTVSSDGTGRFEGKQHTQVTGERSFSVSPAQFAAFRDRLAPFRPQGERRVAPPDCGGMVATDLPSVDVRWTQKGPASHLYAYYGCNMAANAAMFLALKEAPKALPIEAFIGAH